jgi:hypothetical protein
LPSLTIGVLTAENGRFARFWTSLLDLERPSDTRIVVKMGLNIAHSRRDVIRESGQSDFVWFIDDDHVFDYDLVFKLMSRDVPIIQPLVLTRKSPFGPVMMKGKSITEPNLWQRLALDQNMPLSGIIEVDAVGAAGMLIRRDVLNAISDPWFENPPDLIAEDITFCNKARQKGFKVYCDLDNTMGHMNVGSVRPIVKDGKWLTEVSLGDGTFLLPAANKKK